MGEGRFVLYGEDESSGVKWHGTPIDVLAGGPDWLPYDELRDRIEGTSWAASTGTRTGPGPARPIRTTSGTTAWTAA